MDKTPPDTSANEASSTTRLGSQIQHLWQTRRLWIVSTGIVGLLLVLGLVAFVINNISNSNTTVNSGPISGIASMPVSSPDAVVSEPVSTSSSSSSSEAELVVTISPNTANHSGWVTITLTSTPGAKIYYTTNNTAPNNSSQLYVAPFSLESQTKNHANDTYYVHAIAYKDNKTSEVAAQRIEIIQPYSTQMQNLYSLPMKYVDGVTIAGDVLWLVGRKDNSAIQTLKKNTFPNMDAGTEFDLTQTSPVGMKAYGLEVDGNTIWLAYVGNGSTKLVQLNANDASVIRTISGPAGNDFADLSIDGNTIYLSVGSNKITKINKSSGAISDSFAVSASNPGMKSHGITGTNELLLISQSDNTQSEIVRAYRKSDLGYIGNIKVMAADTIATIGNDTVVGNLGKTAYIYKISKVN
jgi:hypothetical protein